MDDHDMLVTCINRGRPQAPREKPLSTRSFDDMMNRVRVLSRDPELVLRLQHSLVTTGRALWTSPNSEVIYEFILHPRVPNNEQ